MTNKKMRPMKEDAETIFRAGLERVNSRKLLEQVLSLKENVLTVKSDSETFALDISKFSKVKVIGFGKAGAQMVSGLCSVLGSIVTEGIVIVKDPTNAVLPSGVKVFVGSHPIPNHKSEEAGKALLEFCNNTQEGELVLGVISGGASALMEVPVDGISMNDLIKTTEYLLASGANINEMNCLRKHLSLIKGGQLSQAIFPALSLNFILSDVIGDDLAVIGSGPTVADPTTFKDALAIIEKYNLKGKLPESVTQVLQAGVNETPKDNDPKLGRTKNVLVGTNRQALVAAKNQARALGYETIIVSDQIDGEASVVASRLYDLSISAEIKKMKKPVCLLAGGETTVTIQGNGLGGRNQEMALAYLCCMDDGDQQVFLSASTDGSDGPTDSTGAFVTADILKNTEKLGLNPIEYLQNNDSYTFFKKVGGHLKTGPTETNVCDLQIILINE